ncbi:hypothetical protein LCGC14_2369560 [marine sediment metagenome]|uniref:Uncharacterized protein n=1 Tax=marine sediment metagenome TaxID=412755 RepID=A0A0F9CRD4_9ZZZZ
MEEMARESCKCGKPSNHMHVENGKNVYYCCVCHIAHGGVGADWHVGCMRAIGRSAVKWDDQPVRRSSLV